MERSKVPTPRDQPALRIHIKRCCISVIQCDAQRAVIDAIDPLAPSQINAMAASLQLMETEKFAGEFHSVPQCRGRFRRLFLDRGSFAFPLPGAVSIERFGVNMFTASHHIDSHSARPGGPVIPVHFEAWINNMQ